MSLNDNLKIKDLPGSNQADKNLQDNKSQLEKNHTEHHNLNNKEVMIITKALQEAEVHQVLLLTDPEDNSKKCIV
jgi:hypothetical protein